MLVIIAQLKFAVSQTCSRYDCLVFRATGSSGQTINKKKSLNESILFLLGKEPGNKVKSCSCNCNTRYGSSHTDLLSLVWQLRLILRILLCCCKYKVLMYMYVQPCGCII